MKSIFEQTTRDEITARINNLSANSAAQWGKMDVFQMLKHCTMFDEWTLGKGNPKYKQSFIGFLFGKMVLKKALQDGLPLKRNTPTIPEFKVSGKGDVEAEKAKWIGLLKEYESFSNPTFIHTFFGKLTPEQIGILAYKHADHHLRQFNS